ncbi:hypothetical protein WN944_026368 [Citrus x changshan-huyou]|uniref:Uncharacterized protein n=1 Tax=Citrus x changshan-huyou TaxID=2935761 RepID=A0AAP0LRI2_9ROSI
MKGEKAISWGGTIQKVLKARLHRCGARAAVVINGDVTEGQKRGGGDHRCGGGSSVMAEHRHQRQGGVNNKGAMLWQKPRVRVDM